VKCENCPTPLTCEAATVATPACRAKNAVLSLDAPEGLFNVSRRLEAEVYTLRARVAQVEACKWEIAKIIVESDEALQNQIVSWATQWRVTSGLVLDRTTGKPVEGSHD
jgi:hypothetical protein